MDLIQLHTTQVSILHSLRYASSARFNELLRPTDHTSDTFKFHVRKLIKLGFIEKLDDGTYQLTAQGKEFANNLDEQTRSIQKQPKLSVLIVASSVRPDGTMSYLMQQRHRDPHRDFWSEIVGPVRWGVSLEDAAAHVLKRQTGLLAEFSVASIRRIRDYHANSKDLLEDKLFVIVIANSIRGELENTYAGGTNSWLTLEELKEQDKVFPSTLQILDSVQDKVLYDWQDIRYDEGVY